MTIILILIMLLAIAGGAVFIYFNLLIYSLPATDIGDVLAKYASACDVCLNAFVV